METLQGSEMLRSITVGTRGNFERIQEVDGSSERMRHELDPCRGRVSMVLIEPAGSTAAKLALETGVLKLAWVSDIHAV